jgi:hypothetical protein
MLQDCADAMTMICRTKDWVYLALKNTFKGAEAQVRKTRKVRELITKKQHNVDVRNLMREHSLINVCNVAIALLQQQIFASTLKAKIRCPEVFEVSPAQSAERSAFEAEAARTEEYAAEGQKSSRSLELDRDAGLRDDEEQPSCTSISSCGLRG